MTKETTAVALRLQQALSARGIDIKQSEAREIAAAAFGHRSTNAMDAAGRRLPSAEIVDDAPGLLALRDPGTGAVFAIDPDAQAAAGRTASTLVSPYGGLLAMPVLDRSASAPSRELTVRIDRDEGFLYWSNDGGWRDFAGADIVGPGDGGSLPSIGVAKGHVFRLPLQTGAHALRPDHQTRNHDALAALVADEPIALSPRLTVRHIHPARRDGAPYLMMTVTGSADDFQEHLRSAADDLAKAKVEVLRIGRHDVLAVPSGPFDGAFDAKHARAALEDLIVPTAGRPRVIATFNPEAWMNDYAVPVDPQGDTLFDVTFEILLMGRAAAAELDDDNYDTDELRYAVRGPDWIRDWGGPFTVHVEDAIQDAIEDGLNPG